MTFTCSSIHSLNGVPSSATRARHRGRLRDKCKIFTRIYTFSYYEISTSTTKIELPDFRLPEILENYARKSVSRVSESATESLKPGGVSSHVQLKWKTASKQFSKGLSSSKINLLRCCWSLFSRIICLSAAKQQNAVNRGSRGFNINLNKLARSARKYFAWKGEASKKFDEN